MDPSNWLAAIGDNKVVQGVIAVYVLLEILSAARSRFGRPDGFADVDWRRANWTDLQRDRYFAEKEAFERRLASRDNGFGQALQAIGLFALVMILVVSLIILAMLPVATTTPKPVLALALIVITALTWRRFAYTCRRLERYHAYRDRNRNWMYAPRLRGPSAAADDRTAQAPPTASERSP